MLKYLINKKGMSPVVSTALLLVVAVASVGIFQGWFQTYSSGLFSGMEQDSSVDVMNTRIDGVLGNNLYFKNGYNNLTITEIKLNDVSCMIDESYGKGMQIINISGCVETHQSTAEVVVVTNRGLFTKTLFVHGDGSSSEELYSSCTLDGVTVDHGDNNTFYNSTSVPFGDSCLSISRTCNNGTFDGDTSYNYSNCSVDGQDTMPAAFNFNDEVDVELDTLIESNTLTPIDYDGNLSVGITGDGSPQISIDDGSSWTTSDDMNPGDNLTIRLNSSSNYNTTSQVNLTLGDYSTIWSVKTKEEVILSSSLICDTDADGNLFISYACGNYPMTDTTLEGHLDPDDSEILVEPDVNCVWKDDKSGCEDNFVVDGCGTDTVLDIGSGLCWQRDFGVAGEREWEEAKSYCDGLSLAGHSDWYLPSRQELATVVDTSRASAPFIVGGNNNKFTNVANYWYWTKTTYALSTGNAYDVSLSYAGSSSSGKTSDDYVACVRRN